MAIGKKEIYHTIEGKEFMKEKAFISKLRKKKHIIIYGAGMVGELVYKRLHINNLSTNVVGFAVSQNPIEKMYMGKPVYVISDLLEYRKTAVVIVATLQDLHHEIMETLLCYGFERIIKIKNSLYKDLTLKYVKDFLKQEKIQGEKYNVLFMASDNNSSSGAFISMVDLNHELNEKGISTLVILPCYGNGERKLIDKGIAYTYILSKDWGSDIEKGRTLIRKSFYKNIPAMKRLRKIIKEHEIQIVHNNTTYTYVGALSAYKENIPVVWHIRENIETQGFTFESPTKAHKVINKANRIIAISRYIKECINYVEKEKVQVIYNGIDVDKFYSKRDILTKNDKVSIILVGAIVKFKGQEELINASRILKERAICDFSIKMIGKGEYQYLQELQDLVKKYNLENNIEILGRQENIQNYYREADIAVTCSAIEAFGRVTVEGQTAGCLVIGADSGATEELIQDGVTGLFYKQGDSENLAERIIWALTNPEISRIIAKQGQEYAYRTYTKENNAHNIIKMYEELLGRELI